METPPLSYVMCGLQSKHINVYINWFSSAASGTVNPSLWQQQCHFLATWWFSSPSIHCSCESWVILRSSYRCVSISDCLFLNPRLMRIKVQLNQNLIPSQAPTKTSYGSGGSCEVHKNQFTRGLYVHIYANFPHVENKNTSATTKKLQQNLQKPWPNSYTSLCDAQSTGPP